MADTARDFITLALKEAGDTGIGQTPLAEDMNDCFKLLHRMLAQWAKRRWIVPNLIDVYASGNNLKSNRIGPGQYYNSARPDKIQSAYFKQLNSGDVANDVSYGLTPIWSYEQYSQIALKELNAWPQYYFYDNAFPFGNVFIWPIPTSAYEVHLIVKGPIGFTIELQAGSISAAGTLYTDGAYVNVPFTNVSSLGGGGSADITVAGGVITNVVLSNPGDGYKINDVLSVANTDVGGTGAGFLWKVTNVTDSLDAEFNMPAEYEEAIHYNLVIRIAAAYQKPINPEHKNFARVALHTLRVSNLQLSKLQMPAALRSNNGGFYIFNADQQ